jgi:hypothetical protein
MAPTAATARRAASSRPSSALKRYAAAVASTRTTRTITATKNDELAKFDNVLYFFTPKEKVEEIREKMEKLIEVNRRLQ